jgi:hypothetical protein
MKLPTRFLDTFLADHYRSKWLVNSSIEPFLCYITESLAITFLLKTSPYRTAQRAAATVAAFDINNFDLSSDIKGLRIVRSILAQVPHNPLFFHGLVKRYQMNIEAANMRLKLDSALKRSRSQMKAADSLHSIDGYSLYRRRAQLVQKNLWAKATHVRSNAWCQQYPFSVAEPLYLALSLTVARLRKTLRDVENLKGFYIRTFSLKSWHGPQTSLILAEQCSLELVTDADDWTALRYHRVSAFPKSFSNGETACMERIYSWVSIRIARSDQRRKGSNPKGSPLYSEGNSNVPKIIRHQRPKHSESTGMSKKSSRMSSPSKAEKTSAPKRSGTYAQSLER